MTTDLNAEAGPAYAMQVADDSYNWYVTASKRSRRYHRLSEFALVALSASIPLTAAVAPGRSAVTALLGSVLVVITGLRTIFHWQENYLRFSRAREEVEAERRLYLVAAPPYADPASRAGELVKAVTRIERSEMSGWIQVAESGRAARSAAG